jgi:hypothetical protein
MCPAREITFALKRSDDSQNVGSIAHMSQREKGGPAMTKAKARARAKARAQAKAANPKTKGDKSDAKPRAGRFDTASNTARNAAAGANTKVMAGAKRGSARSR